MGWPVNKVVLELDLHDEKDKQKALNIVTRFSGIDSIAMDKKDKKMTVIGVPDPVDVVNKLRNHWNTEIISVGPAKVPHKDERKGDAKPDDAKKDNKKKDPNQQIVVLVKKVVLELDLHDEKDKQKALNTVTRFSGIDSIAMDKKDKKMTVIGVLDPVEVVNKLRNHWNTKIVSVGAAKVPHTGDRKVDVKPEDVKKGKEEDPNQQIAVLVKDKGKPKPPNAVTSISGIDSIFIDMKEKKMTVIMTVNPVHVANKLCNLQNAVLHYN